MIFYNVQDTHKIKKSSQKLRRHKNILWIKSIHYNSTPKDPKASFKFTGVFASLFVTAPITFAAFRIIAALLRFPCALLKPFTISVILMPFVKHLSDGG